MKKIQWILIWIFCLTCVKDTALSGYEQDSSSVHLIHEIHPHGITLNEPGEYFFENDITWNPNSDGIAITIKADGVTLNMQGFTLKSSSSSFKSTAILATEVVDLEILNGTIQDMGLAGIKCDQCVDVTIKGIVVDGLNASDTVNYIVPTGILATGCIGVSIDACTVKNIDVKTGSSAAIQLTGTISSQVINCRIQNLLNRDGACTGIGHLSCDDALVKGCRLDRLRSEFIDNLNTEGHTTIGIVPVLTTNLKIEQCVISNLVGCCDDAHGMSIFICDQATIKKCKVSDVIDGMGPAKKGAKATGIEVYASHVNVSDCYVKNIAAINPEDKQATGFSCALCYGVKFIRCKAKNVQVFDEDGHQSPRLGYGTGFGWAPDPRPEFIAPAKNILYSDCLAEDCQVGFDSWFHIDSTWNGIISKHNAIAILNKKHTQRTLSCNPCSECGCHQTGCFPTPIVVTLNNEARNNRFIHVKVKNPSH